ncbi:MAG TPA: redoxin domain-containing protein [Nocardioidaceae bacterium]|nr:redoxin domain-containing protein [Nocardioidaceae bacterium]
MTAGQTRHVAVAVSVLAVAGLAVLLATGLGSAGSQSSSSALVGDPAPPLAGRTLQGTHFSLDSLDGAVVLVNIWASWCGPCREEIPLLVAAKRNWADSGVELVTINTRDGPAAARSMLRELGATELRSVRDPQGELAVAWGAAGVPETYVVDRDGIVRARRVGVVTEQWLREQLSPLVAR